MAVFPARRDASGPWTLRTILPLKCRRSMEIKNLFDRLKKLDLQRKVLAATAATSLLTNVLLSIAIVRNEKQIVLVPPQLSQESIVSNAVLSTAYLEEMSLYFLSRLLDMTAETMEANRTMMMRHIHPSYHRQMETHFELEKKRYHDFGLSTYFVPQQLSVDHKKLTVVASGQLRSQFGSNGQDVRNASYRLDYEYRGGILLISGFHCIKEEPDKES